MNPDVAAVGSMLESLDRARARRREEVALVAAIDAALAVCAAYQTPYSLDPALTIVEVPRALWVPFVQAMKRVA